MNSNLVTDLGENFEYVKTIVTNEIEIKKLDFVESGATIVSKIVSSLLIFFFLFLAFIAGVITLTIILSQSLGSPIYALLVIIGMMIFLSLVVLVFRKFLIVNPISKLFFKLIK